MLKLVRAVELLRNQLGLADRRFLSDLRLLLHGRSLHRLHGWLHGRLHHLTAGYRLAAAALGLDNLAGRRKLADVLTLVIGFSDLGSLMCNRCEVGPAAG